jgi:hypothetical protein
LTLLSDKRHTVGPMDTQAQPMTDATDLRISILYRKSAAEKLSFHVEIASKGIKQSIESMPESVTATLIGEAVQVLNADDTKFNAPGGAA